jgi:predicted LPLAT superfamily acyltransferase
MPSWSGKTRGGISGYKTIVFIIRHFGLGTAYFFLNFVVLYFVVTSPRSNRSSYQYFRKILKHSPIRSLLNVYKNYHVFGQTLIDKITILSGIKHKLTFEFDGEEHLHSLAEKTSGAMLMSAHIGSFEIAGYLLKRINAKINILMFEAEHARIKQYLSGVYKDMTAGVITIKNDMSHIYDIKNVFENKEFLCLHGDRFVNDNKTISRPFMGQQAKFPAGPFMLALKFNIPVCFVFAMKERKYHYHFYSTEPKLYYREKLNLKTRDQDLSRIIDDYIAAFEHALKKHPVQWFNFYYFWT